MLAAGALYSFHLGRTLGASEAYTAMAVDQPSYAAVIHAALRFDQCKPPLYQILLHAVVLVLGSSETVLRAPSVIFALVSVGVVLALGSRMFSPAVGVAAALLWAFSPVAIIYGGWARMYAMMVAVALLQFLLLWRLRSRESGAWLTIACGALGAAMLYTHLGNVLVLGAEAAMLMGTTLRGERNRAAWAALLLAAIAFVPFVPLATSQLSQYVVWPLGGLDWTGPSDQPPRQGRRLPGRGHHRGRADLRTARGSRRARTVALVRRNRPHSDRCVDRRFNCSAAHVRSPLRRAFSRDVGTAFDRGARVARR